MRITPKDPAKGILDFPRALQQFTLQRYQPAMELRPWLDSYWVIAWDLPDGEAHEQTNLSHSSVNAALEPDGAFVYGVPGRVFRKRIAGKGQVFGTKFRPGGFFPFICRSVKSLTGKVVTLADVFGPKGAEWVRANQQMRNDEDRVQLADSVWRSVLSDTPLRPKAAPGPSAAVIAAEKIQSDRSILKVDQAAAAIGVDVRTLQRMFQREVGIGPKEVIKRIRLQEAAETLLRSPGLSCGKLALDVGYFDQAHFIRDFKSVVGATPDAYRRRQPGFGRQETPGRLLF
jgi:AraC-like DNA-binding protein